MLQKEPTKTETIAVVEKDNHKSIDKDDKIKDKYRVITGANKILVEELDIVLKIRQNKD